VTINRQLFPPVYASAGIGSFHRRWAIIKAAEKRDIYLTWHALTLVCKAHECLEIDEPIDVAWAEFLLSQKGDDGSPY
jgi:hypothetical protein